MILILLLASVPFFKKVVRYADPVFCHPKGVVMLDVVPPSENEVEPWLTAALVLKATSKRAFFELSSDLFMSSHPLIIIPPKKIKTTAIFFVVTIDFS